MRINMDEGRGEINIAAINIRGFRCNEKHMKRLGKASEKVDISKILDNVEQSNPHLLGQGAVFDNVTE